MTAGGLYPVITLHLHGTSTTLPWVNCEEYASIPVTFRYSIRILGQGLNVPGDRVYHNEGTAANRPSSSHARKSWRSVIGCCSC